MESWKQRTAMLLGEDALDRMARSTVIVVGVGGVGAYAAEMVARAGIGRLVLIDSDTVEESNLNRQMVALRSTIGLPKVDVLSARILDINPSADIIPVRDYLTPENIDSLLGQYSCPVSPSPGPISPSSVPVSPSSVPVSTSSAPVSPSSDHVSPYSVPGSSAGGNSGTSNRDAEVFVIDAIDTVSPKISLIKYCLNHKLPFVSAMGAGAKSDITRIRIADISDTFNCTLAAVIRKRLRKEGISKGVPVVFSEELPDRNAVIPVLERNKNSAVGSISYLTAAFGCALAQSAITHFRN
ncbi:MAG: tRNA threonylcarbamoyladenosine dehydratase [Bacteroidales bacterium]|nr:tRNA threonylcarbamoyladenosine dehydratase [Bacteroidales bacterium]